MVLVRGSLLGSFLRGLVGVVQITGDGLVVRLRLLLDVLLDLAIKGNGQALFLRRLW